MGIQDQPVTLVASPSYPDSIAWSKDNLLAIASGHLITIINPASPVRPRGLITLPPSNPFAIGVINKEEVLDPCVMPLSLSRDVRPCARSISWSPSGFAPNAGCLLAVCTTEGRVKVYRPPYCEYRPEWVEVVDISDMLYHYLKSIHFGELKDPFVTFSHRNATAVSINESGSTNGLEDSVSSKLPMHRKTMVLSRRTQENKYVEFLREELSDGAYVDSLIHSTDAEYDEPQPRKKAKFTASTRAATKINIKRIMSASAAINPCSSVKQGSSAEKFPSRQPDRTQNNSPQLITPCQYASRSALLSSLIISWSPTLQTSGVDCLNIKNNCSILAVGGKSGNISFWRIYEPQSYTIEHGGVSVDPVLIGLLQAHNSWITAISWGIYVASSSKSQLVLATGSCDGSVKIWLRGVEELIKSSEADNFPFSLLREVTAVTSVPVSTISLVVPVLSLDEVVLAIGRGSGSLEVWFCHISTNKYQSTNVYNAHNQVVKGLTWAFDGGCLYSCGQDNSVRSWVLREKALCGTPFPLNFLGQKNPIDLSQVSDLCFGLASSPGGLVVAVVRSFDSQLLDPMYQARIQKAAVEFYWTRVPSDNFIEDDFNLSEVDMKANILWSLKHYDDRDEPLVLWDILMPLLSFRRSKPGFVEGVLSKWMSSWFVDYQSGDSLENILLHMQNMLSTMSTRRLHLLNIVSRRLMLAGCKRGICHELEGVDGKLDLWNKLLLSCERELQERFVAFTFKAVLRSASYSATISISNNSTWPPVGVVQMEKWVTINPSLVHGEQLRLLGSKLGEFVSRIRTICEYTEEERCSYCSAAVPFESVEVGRCQGVKHQDGSTENHELKRCSVSMQLDSLNSPMWYCMCCKRQSLKLPPLSFFTMSQSPLDVNYESEVFAPQQRSKPLCIFCGILLQRLLPEFLLSTSLV